MKESLLKTSKDFISFLHKKRLVLTICAIITLVFGLLNIFVFSNHSEALDSDAFITTWKVSGDSDGRTVKIPVYKNIYKHKINNAAYNYTIDWGDGSPIEAKSGYVSPSHTYANDGEYDIKIEGDFPGMTFSDEPRSQGRRTYYSDAFPDNDDRASESMGRKILFIKQWGKIKWQSMIGMFFNAYEMTGRYTDSPDTSEVKSMNHMFRNAMKFNSPVNFDTSKVEDMGEMFKNANSFNQPVNFDTQNVENMGEMFIYAPSFNQPLNFNTSKVTNMYGMLRHAKAFNHPVNFDTRNVESMSMMFSVAEAFNQPVNFDTSKVTSMYGMFDNAIAFNQPVNFDTSKVTNMGGMFIGATSFNQPINFNTSSIQYISEMFKNATSFNYPVNLSDTSRVNYFSSMFEGATSFNQPINFNTSNATNFGNMFKNATSFNQDISNLDFSVALKRGQYDDGMGDFASNSGLSIKNYDKILKNWHDAVKNDPSITFHHKPSSAGLKYCTATTEHDFLVGLGWTFNDTRDCGIAPQDINLSSNTIDENTPPNTKVADIAMPSDPNDTPGDTNTASLTCATPGADDNAFTITNNKLYLKNPADYEAKNSYNICIRATDEYGNFLDKNFTININNNNELPVVTSTPITTATQGSPYSYTITASDPENAPLTFTASPSNPSWLHFNPSTHVVSGTPSQADAGRTFQVSFTISDGTNTIEHKYNITVSGNGNNQGGNNNQGGGNNGGHNGNQGGGNSGSAGGRGGSNVVNNYTHYHTHITNQNTRNSSNGSGGGSVTDSNPARSDSNNGSNVNDSNSDSSSNKDSNKSLKDKTISSSSHRGNNSSNCQCPVAGSSKKEKRSFFDMTIGELWWFWILIILILIGIIAYLVLRNRDREDEFKEKRVGF